MASFYTVIKESQLTKLRYQINDGLLTDQSLRIVSVTHPESMVRQEMESDPYENRVYIVKLFSENVGIMFENSFCALIIEVVDSHKCKHCGAATETWNVQLRADRSSWETYREYV